MDILEIISSRRAKRTTRKSGRKSPKKSTRKTARKSGRKTRRTIRRRSTRRRITHTKYVAKSIPGAISDFSQALTANTNYLRNYIAESGKRIATGLNKTARIVQNDLQSVQRVYQPTIKKVTRRLKSRITNIRRSPFVKRLTREAVKFGRQARNTLRRILSTRRRRTLRRTLRRRSVRRARSVKRSTRRSLRRTARKARRSVRRTARALTYVPKGCGCGSKYMKKEYVSNTIKAASGVV